MTLGQLKNYLSFTIFYYNKFFSKNFQLQKQIFSFFFAHTNYFFYLHCYLNVIYLMIHMWTTQKYSKIIQMYFFYINNVVNFFLYFNQMIFFNLCASHYLITLKITRILNENLQIFWIPIRNERKMCYRDEVLLVTKKKLFFHIEKDHSTFSTQ